VSFFIGTDANSSFGGQKYDADAATLHPQFDRENMYNDIALYHLVTAVPTSVATPIAINTANVTVARRSPSSATA